MEGLARAIPQQHTSPPPDSQASMALAAPLIGANQANQQ
jgi:hypothetical protein